jgi:guanylate kinase
VSSCSTPNPPDARVIVLSGPSGSGKTTIVNRLLAEAPVKLYKAISATTRPPRQNEIDGVDYYFLTPEEFDARRERGDFLECEQVHKSGYWYGTLRSELEKARGLGAWAFLEIDVHGALHVMQQYPDAVTIFLQTPSLDDYERRLRARGTESEEYIRRRLETAREELKSATRYGYQVLNDDLNRAVREISNILLTRETQSHAG